MRTLLAATLALALAPCAAQAQFNPNYRPPIIPGSYYNSFSQRPGLSPYLNLLRGGSPAANYYLGTRPEQQRRAQAALFNNEIGDLQDRSRVAGEDLTASPIVRSGTIPYLNNTGGFFNNTSGYFANPQGVLAPLSRPGTPSPAIRKPGQAFRPGPSSGTVPIR